MDLTPYKNQLLHLRQCITNVEVARSAYREALEMQSFGMQGAGERLREAAENVKSAEDTLRSQSRIDSLLIKEVYHKTKENV